MNVILQGDGRPFGVLEVDSRSDDEFVEHDLAFLQGAANLLGMAIERERHERSLEAALERHQVLLKEMNHRVKNSLTIVSSMLAAPSERGRRRGADAASQRGGAAGDGGGQRPRSALAWPDVERMDIGRYIEAVCRDLDDDRLALRDPHRRAEHGIEIATDRAISAALIVNELIANAAKYAYPAESGGEIWVRLAAGVRRRRSAISVRDEGDGASGRFRSCPAEGARHAASSWRSSASSAERLLFTPGRAPSSSLRSRARRRAERQGAPDFERQGQGFDRAVGVEQLRIGPAGDAVDETAQLDLVGIAAFQRRPAAAATRLRRS